MMGAAGDRESTLLSTTSQQMRLARAGSSIVATMQQPAKENGSSNDAAAAASASGGEGDDLLSSPEYAPFLAPDFNAAEFTSRVLAGSRTNAHAQAEELRRGARALDSALAAAVSARHVELLGHARRLLDAEAGAADVSLAVAALQAAARRVRAEVEAPAAAVRAKTRQLAALHATVGVLRALLARLKLTARLRALLDAPPEAADPAKAARLLADALAASADGALDGVALAEADAPFLARAGTVVRAQAQAALSEGVTAMSQAQVGAALQVYFNLDELPEAVDAGVTRALADLDRAARAALDNRQLGAGAAAAAAAARGGLVGGGPGGARGLVGGAAQQQQQPGGAASGIQDKLWAGIRSVCDALVAGGVACWHVQRVAAKKRDPLTHVLFADVLAASGMQPPTERYWSEALRVLGDAFGAAARPTKGGYAREALSAGYPRLAAALEAAFARLAADMRVHGVPPAVTGDRLPALLAVAAPFRDAYLAAALARLTDAVAAAYPGAGRPLPSPADVQKVVAAMHGELRAVTASFAAAGVPSAAAAATAAAGGSGAGVVAGGTLLAADIAGVVGGALRQLASRAECASAAGPELRALALTPGAGGASQAQQRNIALASQLQEVHRSMTALLPRLPPAAAAALEEPLAVLHAAAVDAVAPFFRALVDSAEARLLAMHDAHAARWGGTAGAAAAGATTSSSSPHAEGGDLVVTETSAHVAEVVAALTAFRSEYLLRFTPPPSHAAPSAAGLLCERAAGRLLSYFVRHAALLRPMPRGAALAVAKDLGELSAAVGGALWPIEALGPAARCARAFRAALFVDDARLCDVSAAPLRDLAPSVALHHLFSRLPGSVQAPHERAGLTPAAYSRWLDAHTAAEAARGVAAALDAAALLPVDDVDAHSAQTTAAAAAIVRTMRSLCASAGGGD